MCVFAVWLLLWVSAYWCLTLLDWQFLAPLLTDVRRAAMGVGTVGLILALIWAEPGEPGWLRVVPLAVGLAATFYSWRNQWLIARAAIELQPCSLAAEDDALVAVLSGGQGIPLSVLAHARTAVFGDQLLVHCGLARSLAAFTRNSEERPAAVLPHRTGFYIGSATALWDGVDGSASQGGADLEPRSLHLCSYQTWHAANPDAELLAPQGLDAIPPPRTRTPHLPGAAGVEDALAWGRVDSDGWHELSADDLNSVKPSDSKQRYLGRWAAQARGLAGTTRHEAE